MERLILRAHTDTRKGKTERIKSFPGCGLDKTKEMQFDMEKEEIYEMVIQEMTEHALTQRREACSEEEKKLYQEENELSEKPDMCWRASLRKNARWWMIMLPRRI